MIFSKLLKTHEKHYQIKASTLLIYLIHYKWFLLSLSFSDSTVYLYIVLMFSAYNPIRSNKNKTLDQRLASSILYHQEAKQRDVINQK